MNHCYMAHGKIWAEKFKGAWASLLGDVNIVIHMQAKDKTEEFFPHNEDSISLPLGSLLTAVKRLVDNHYRTRCEASSYHHMQLIIIATEVLFQPPLVSSPLWIIHIQAWFCLHFANYIRLQFQTKFQIPGFNNARLQLQYSIVNFCELLWLLCSMDLANKLSWLYPLSYLFSLFFPSDSSDFSDGKRLVHSGQKNRPCQPDYDFIEF